MDAYRGPLEWLVERPIAHRGLHDAARDRPENSIPAALAAADGHFAIECDVQLSRDGTPYIFHDDTLQRLCGVAGEFRGTSDARVAELRLTGSAWPVPTLASFLSSVDGRVPIVMELKGRSPQEDVGYFAALAPELQRYGGRIALMSFDEWLIDQMIEAGTGRPVGLTAEGRSPEMLDRHARVYARGCSFVSYRVEDLPNPFVDTVIASGGAVVTWTVRDREGVELTTAQAHQMTFEGFTPQA
ncbi:glycerophosphodiester phosphodiesterase family protein [Aurantimonas sp. Leaf443]|uniref:glycerophosphodiester phosphodiesterase family protein n=1 Tax=Aurantimonas sp. Leaf443 TaxID=1736378 RepID=UPI0006F1D083|nr:glycerophosphodiester phosphodiesterase family protein [Aurantimonas sp. Leaf443]KQT83434.1 glycerophosphodiester phosphodiesterase [Aurantimonas sp. Leaf443]